MDCLLKDKLSGRAGCVASHNVDFRITGFSRDCQSAMPNGLLCGLQFDFDVVAKAVKALHELALREVGEVAAHQAGYLCLRDADAPRCFLLGETEAADGSRDLNRQTGFDLQLFRMRKSKVAKDVARLVRAVRGTAKRDYAREAIEWLGPREEDRVDRKGESHLERS